MCILELFGGLRSHQLIPRRARRCAELAAHQRDLGRGADDRRPREVVARRDARLRAVPRRRRSRPVAATQRTPIARANGPQLGLPASSNSSLATVKPSRSFMVTNAAQGTRDSLE